MERRQRLLAEIQKLGLDGVLISSPENIFYATGLSPHQLTVSRRPGFASALFRADDAAGMLCTMDYEAPALASRAQGVEIVPYATWVGVKSEREWRDKRDAPGDALPGADEALKGMFEKLKLASGFSPPRRSTLCGACCPRWNGRTSATRSCGRARSRRRRRSPSTGV